jgi:predicted secreted protein with PEFG-CTERM motif
LHPHQNTTRNYTFFVNGISDEFQKYNLEINDRVVHYWSDVGEISRGKIDKSSNSLLMNLNATKTGSLEILLPRNLIDAKLDGEDEAFYVIVDGKEIFAVEGLSTEKERNLKIPVLANAQEINIVGTYVVPEFGMMGILVLIIAISCIILFTSNSKITNLKI